VSRRSEQVASRRRGVDHVSLEDDRTGSTEYRRLCPAAREVIGQRQENHDGKPECAAANHDPRQPRTVTHVHEKQGYQDGFADRDGQSYDRVQGPQIGECHESRDKRKDHEQPEDVVVELLWYDVARHS
jgi:hypothetical protein